MTHTNGHEPQSGIALDEPSTMLPEADDKPQPSEPLFATRKRRTPRPLPQNSMILVAGGAVVVALLLFVFSSAPARKHTATKAKPDTAKRTVDQAADNSDEQKSLFPIIESTKPPASTPNGGRLGEQDLEHTAKRQPQPTFKTLPDPGPPQAGTLGSIPPFEAQGAWQAPPYQPTGSPPAATEPNAERERASLVFVQKVSTSNSNDQGRPTPLDEGPGLGLPIGTRLRARLESAVSTAVRTPVVAVIEYNYERDGEIVVPAGTKAFGRIEEADRSGYMGIKFSSFLMPDGSETSVDGQATNLSLGPLRGKVEGKNSGKNVLTRSLSGIGEVGALLAGRGGSINQPFSEGDLIRERISTNIGESADREITRLAVTEHVVVSVYANTPIYIILERTTKQLPPVDLAARKTGGTDSNSIDSLRQLLQLQKELNQTAESASH